MPGDSAARTMLGAGRYTNNVNKNVNGMVAINVPEGSLIDLVM